jgi:hypothetical protein
VQKPLGTHDAGIKCVDYVKSTGRWYQSRLKYGGSNHCLIASGQIVTGAWDKSVKLWDARAPTPLLSTLAQPDKVFTMDLSEHK